MASPFDITTLFNQMIPLIVTVMGIVLVVVILRSVLKGSLGGSIRRVSLLKEVGKVK